VAGFTKGQEIEVGNDSGFSTRPFIFIQYRPELASPFECVTNGYERKFENNGLYNVNTWQFARPIQPKYKAYEKFDANWMGKKIKSNDDSYVLKIVVGFYKNEILLVGESDNLITKTCLKDMFENATWLVDGTPCGDLIP